MTAPTILKIKRHAGIAGQYEVAAEVQYPGEDARAVTFVGSTYGGPIVMVTEHSQVFVSSEVTDRIGSTLNESWVRRFFGEGE